MPNFSVVVWCLNLVKLPLSKYLESSSSPPGGVFVLCWVILEDAEDGGEADKEGRTSKRCLKFSAAAAAELEMLDDEVTNCA